MRMIRASPSSETYSAKGPQLDKTSRKRLYAALGIIAVAAVAVTLVLLLLIPPSASETIPLTYNYTAGEEMIYNMTTMMETNGQNIALYNGTVSMKILSFDGKNYTINETMTYSPPANLSTSFVLAMNKTGYGTIINGPAYMTQTLTKAYGNVWPFFQKDQTKVNETWQIPVNWDNSADSFNGTIIYKFGDVQDTTVPAGNYRTFILDVSGTNMTMVTSTLSENITVIGHMHLEYGTCRIIDMNIQENFLILQGGQTSTQSVFEQMMLVKHTTP